MGNCCDSGKVLHNFSKGPTAGSRPIFSSVGGERT